MEPTASWRRSVAERPLEGRRIVVTRVREQSQPLAEALERLGARVAVVPLIGIEPAEGLESTTGPFEDYDWVVFTSANGVTAVRDRLAEAGIDGVKVAAVGPATAEAARRLGVEPSFVPQRYAANEIAAGLEPLEEARVLLPQADIASPRLAEELRRRGAIVDAIAAYRTIAIEPTSSGLSALMRADAVVLASGSAARSFAAWVGRDGGERALLVCIGSTTAEAAREVGLPVGLVADEATSGGIIRALVAHFGEKRR